MIQIVGTTYFVKFQNIIILFLESQSLVHLVAYKYNIELHMVKRIVDTFFW